MTEVYFKGKTWTEDLSKYNLYIKNILGGKKISDINSNTIRTWQRKLTAKKKVRGEGNISKTTINRAYSIISTVYNQCARHLDNPCAGIKKYKEQKRTVFLKQEQLKKFFSELNSIATPDYLKDFLLLSLYTGARRSNLLGMRWRDVDLDQGLWVIPGDETKNEEAQAIPLLKNEISILERRKGKASSIFVFPSTKSKTGHLVEPKKAWKSFLQRAGLQGDYRLHDLRRTLGSWQAMTGSSTKLIGATLGHRSDQATAHYAHLTIDPVRAAKKKALDAMEEAKDMPDKVVGIKKG